MDQTRVRAPRVRRLVTFLLVIGVASAVTQAASAYSWTGWVGIGQGNGRCQWYPGQSACSGSTTWTYIKAQNAIGGTALAGFENSGHIRGSYINANETVQVYRSALGLSQPTQGHVTYCTWSTSCFTVWGSAGIQMTVV
jgi:hypothetical protein